MLKGLLKLEFADRGDSLRTNEEAAYIHFVDFMDECEGRIFRLPHLSSLPHAENLDVLKQK